MSQYSPFIFGAGGGQPPPVPSQQPVQPAQQPNGTSLDQQQQPPTAMTLPQLSSLDAQALQGVTPHQLATIIRLMQAGLLTAPPDPSIAPGIPAPAAAPTQIALVEQGQAPEVQVPHVSDAFAQDQDMDDRDEGEIDELEEAVSDKAKEARGFLHPPPTGPRNPQSNQRAPQLEQRKPSPRPPQPSEADEDAEGQDIKSKEFVLILLRSGYTFDDILKEIGNAQALARMFKELRLEVPPEYANSKAAPPVVEKPQMNGGAVTKPIVKRPAPGKPPAPAKPVDRSAYLAKLKALKDKKADPTAKSPTITAPAPVPEPAPAPAPESATTRDPPNDPELVRSSSAGGTTPKPVLRTKDEITALARQRLEAFKAQQAAKQQAAAKAAAGVDKPNSPAQPSSRDPAFAPVASNAGLGAGLDTVALRASQLDPAEQSNQFLDSLGQVHPAAFTQPLISPPPATPTRSLSGLPGLFMFGQPPQTQNQTSAYPPPAASFSNVPAPPLPSNVGAQNAQFPTGTPTASLATLNVPRKRPVASDFDYPTAKPKRPFGRHRGASPDEPIIISNSDDEDDADDEMDTDTGEVPTTKTPTASFRNAAPLREFPGRSNFPVQASGPNTPGGSTPGGNTYEQTLKNIEELKRTIAEKEKRKLANGKAASEQKAGGAGAVATSGMSSPVPHGSSGSTPKVVGMPLAAHAIDNLGGVMYTGTTGALGADANGYSDRPMSAATLANHQEKEKLQQRLDKLQQDESTDIDVAVEAAARDTQVSTEPSQSQLDAAVQGANTPVVQETQMQGTAIETSNGLDDELDEGEISDDFNFYDADDTPGAPADVMSAQKESNTESQPSNTEDVGNSDQAMDFAEPPVIDETQPASLMPDMPQESQSANAQQSDVQTGADTVELPSQPVIDLEEDEDSADEDEDEDEDEESDTSSDESDSDEDSQDLDRPPDSRRVGAAAADHGKTMPDDVDMDGENDDYDPADSTMEPTSEPGELVDHDVVPTSFSAVESDPVMQEEFPDADLAPELQPTASEQAEVTPQPSSTHHFKPYESALRGFKDYKWHSDFLNTTSQGFKSMTYSHKIDTFKELCRYEAMGGQCNDPTCPFQHFKDMGLTDNELLKLLGTHNPPAHSPADQKRWNEGLGSVIKQLRLSNFSRDVNAIAAAIAQFRREFVGDETTVLNLR